MPLHLLSVGLEQSFLLAIMSREVYLRITLTLHLRSVAVRYPPGATLSDEVQKELCDAMRPFNSELPLYLGMPPSQIPWKTCGPAQVY